MITCIQIIAMLTMVIDHAAIVFFIRWPVFRMIGRIAFPLYAFLTMNSVYSSQNRQRYISRLCVLALISEPFYDCMHGGGSQNVIWTLLLGALAVAICEYDCNRFLKFTVWPVAAILSLIFESDYGPVGVILCGLYYISFKSRKFEPWMAACSYILLMSVIFCIAGLNPGFYIFALLAPVLLAAHQKTEAIRPKKPPLAYRLIYRYFYALHLGLLILILRVIN